MRMKIKILIILFLLHFVAEFRMSQSAYAITNENDSPVSNEYFHHVFLYFAQKWKKSIVKMT